MLLMRRHPAQWLSSGIFITLALSSEAACGSRTTNDSPPPEAGSGGEATAGGGAVSGGAPTVQPTCRNMKGFYEDEHGNCRRFRPCDDTSDCAAHYECVPSSRAGHHTCEPLATCEVPSQPDPDVICATVGELKAPSSDPYPRARHPERVGEDCPAFTDVQFAPEPSDACRVIGECGPVTAATTDGTRLCCYAGPTRCGPTLP
jgi:hypothetical protein